MGHKIGQLIRTMTLASEKGHPTISVKHGLPSVALNKHKYLIRKYIKELGVYLTITRLRTSTTNVMILTQNLKIWSKANSQRTTPPLFPQFFRNLGDCGTREKMRTPTKKRLLRERDGEAERAADAKLRDQGRRRRAKEREEGVLGYERLG